ncbi:phosphotransferase enzyme family protein [Sorangium sp. So ce1024]|uniref:phosphotransferase enzyme family protein n=1 Tax=Sorangium sp. So ce1024 TaxID=3133327 RepID=UPI003EFC8736
MIKSGSGAFQLVVYTSAVGRQLRSDAREFHALGAGLAAIHRGLNDYVPVHPVSSLGRTQLLERPLELIMARVSTAPLRGSLERAVERLRPVLDGLSTLGPGYGVCHGDAHHGNTHIDDSGAITFFDFEDIVYGWRAYDWATAIWGTFGRGGNAELWDALVRGYNTVRPLDEDEGESIKFLIAARHIWWMGLHAATWGQWRRAWLDATFFDRSVELLGHICRDACGLSDV